MNFTTRGEGLLTAGDMAFVHRLALINVALFAVLVTGQWLVWTGLPSIWDEQHEPGPTVAGRAAGVLIATLVCGLASLAIWRAARPLLARPPWAWEAVSFGGAWLAAVPQALLLPLVDGTPAGPRALLVLWVTAALGYSIALGGALLTAGLIVRYRQTDDERRAEETRAAEIVARLEDEELRIRQLVADKLHGTIQNRLIVATSALSSMAAGLASGGDDERAAELQQWADDLDSLREEDVRTVSHTLFPTGANISTLDAIRLLLARLPPSIDTSVEMGPGMQAIVGQHRAPIPVPARLTLVYTVEEAVTNALKHGAHTVRVNVDATAGPDPASRVIHLIVDDDGAGLAQPDPPLHGLARHRDRIHARGGTLQLEDSPAGGTRLHATLPTILLEPGNP